MSIYKCLKCGIECKITRQKSNKYCSNLCQRNYQSEQRIKKWLEEGRSWTYSIPKWVHRVLAEQRGYFCETCGITDYNGKPIKLECDHIDGDHTNNLIDNLRLICPNCHSQTETYKGKNKGKGRSYRQKQSLRV
jgi:hypothetical protein